ncbi:MAG: hypothetical protein ACM3NQ_21925 [Bacteroidales bacterium]
MTEPGIGNDTALTGAVCAQCSRTVELADTIMAGDRAFCRPCYASLRAELQSIAEATRTDVNYLQAALGAGLGGVIGTLAWWGFTVLTHIAFGLFAVAIGFLVGQGTVRFSGGKRSRGLQVLSVTVALLSYVAATYLVNMTFINQSLASEGAAFRLGFPPQTAALFFRVVSIGFGLMDVVFLAIVVWEAWKAPRPIALPPEVRA